METQGLSANNDKRGRDQENGNTMAQPMKDKWPRQAYSTISSGIECESFQWRHRAWMRTMTKEKGIKRVGKPCLNQWNS